MPITFTNIKNGQVVTLSREPQIAAFINSGDMHPNSNVQDFGWRLDAETLRRIDRMKANPEVRARIARERGILAQDLKTTHYITELIREDEYEKQVALQQVNDNPVHAEAYEASVRAMRAEERGGDENVPADEPVTQASSTTTVAPQASEPKKVAVEDESAPAVVKVKSSPAKKPAPKKK